MPLEIPTQAENLTQAQQDLQIEVDNGLRKPLRDAIAYAISALVFALYLRLRFLSKQLFLDTARLDFALRWASLYGFTPNDPTQAAGPVLISGTNGQQVFGGEILQRGDGEQYSVDGPATIVAGQATIDVTAVNAGLSGNAEPATALTFVAPPAGIDADAVVAGGTGDPGIAGGLDVESSEDLVARALAGIRAPNIAGAEADYVTWALDVDGVDTAFARGSYMGIGTVLVIITQKWDPTLPLGVGNTPVPAQSIIDSVEVFIERRKPAGLWLVAVQGPILQPLSPFIELDPDTPDIRNAVTVSLQLALDRVEPGTIIYYDDLVDAINRAAGEEHHRLWIDDGGGQFGPNNTQLGPLAKAYVDSTTITWTAPP